MWPLKKVTQALNRRLKQKAMSTEVTVMLSPTAAASSVAAAVEKGELSFICSSKTYELPELMGML